MARKRELQVARPPKRAFEIANCLNLRDKIDDARCGVAVAGFSLESTGTKISEAAIKLARAGASTAITPLEKIKNDLDLSGTPVDKLARKVKAAATRARTLLKSENGGDIQMERLDQARQALSKAAAFMAKLKIEADHLCLKGRD